MQDQRSEKVRGLAFGRALQNAVRTGTVFSLQHASSTRPIQQSFDLLVPLLKSGQRFTIGFVDQRIMINNILTKDGNLRQLENEFLKRGIGAVTFEVGLTLESYKKFLVILTTSINAIEEIGGLLPFLAKNAVDGVRVHAAPKNEKRSDDGDTILEVDSATYLQTKAAASSMALPDLAGLEMLIEAAGQEEAPQWGGGGPADILRLVNQTVQQSVADSRGDPRKSYVALARMLQDLKPEFILPAFPAQRQQELQAMPTERVAAEFIENAAFQWAAKRIHNAPAGAPAAQVEDEIVNVLMRSLYATEMADALAQKLSYYFQQYAIPKTTFEKLQEELRWISMPRAEKHAQLLKVEQFTPRDVRRLIDHVRDLLKRSDWSAASAVALHYFRFLEGDPAKIAPELLSRAPEIVNDLAGVRTFAAAVCRSLCRVITSDASNEFVHFQLVNAAVALASRTGLCENFDLVDQIAQTLRGCVAENPERHARCCAAGQPNLLAPAAIERLVEIGSDPRTSSELLNSASRLMRFSDSLATRFLQRMEQSEDSAERLRLLRLLGRSGPKVLHLIRDRLKSPVWYVARNACVLAAELRDPEIVAYVSPLLQNSNERVQEAAVNALLRSKDPARLIALANALHCLARPLREKVLWELSFAKDKETVQAIGQFIFRHSYGDSKSALAAVEVLAAIKDESTYDLLGAVVCDESFTESVRRTALQALQRDGSEYSRRLVEEIIKFAPGDQSQQAASGS